MDNYHLEAYGKVAVNYNRDIQLFPLLRRIIENITGEKSFYQSPTDMGVNMLASGIIDDAVVQEAAKQEIIRRSFDIENDFKKGKIDDEGLHRMQFIMEESGLSQEDRPCVNRARDYMHQLQDRFASDEVQAAMAIELANGDYVYGKTGSLLDSSAAAIVNSLKHLAGIAPNIDLLSQNVLETIQTLKREQLHSRTLTLSANEVLIALAISAVTNPLAKVAYDKLNDLEHAQAHSTVIITRENIQTLKKLGMDVTNDPVYGSKQHFME